MTTWVSFRTHWEPNRVKPLLPLIIISDSLTNSATLLPVQGPPPAILARPFHFEELLTQVQRQG